MKVRFLQTVILATCLAIVAPISAIADHHNSGDHPERAAALLQQMEAAAMDIRDHAGAIKTRMFMPMLTSHAWHDYQLSSMRQETDQLAEFAAKFEDHKGHATQRQNKAFNVILTQSAEISNHLNEAIKIANERPSKLNVAHPDYMEHIEAIYDSADEAIAGASLAEDYSEVVEARKELSQ